MTTPDPDAITLDSTAVEVAHALAKVIRQPYGERAHALVEKAWEMVTPLLESVEEDSDAEAALGMLAVLLVVDRVVDAAASLDLMVDRMRIPS